MPKQHKGDSSISDLELKRVTSNILVTWVNETRRLFVVVHAQETRCVANDKVSVTLPKKTRH